jgi:hypothetical protein
MGAGLLSNPGKSENSIFSVLEVAVALVIEETLPKVVDFLGNLSTIHPHSPLRLWTRRPL